MQPIALVDDLVEEIVKYFDGHGIRFDRGEIAHPQDLLESYFYILAKTIVPIPRYVHYSLELNDRIRTLEQRYMTPLGAIRERFEAGGDLTEFLSKRALDATARDGLFSDFGIHHFHLGTKSNPNDRHVQRTGHLLFAFEQGPDAYFLDVRRHPNESNPTDFGWCDEELLTVIDSNWPEVLNPYVVPGVSGTSVTNEQKKELRRKNTNILAVVGGKVLAPPGGGLLANGRNARCKMSAMRLIHEIDGIEGLLANHWAECRVSLEQAGFSLGENPEFRLVRLGGTNLPARALRTLSGDLSWSGWGIAEISSGTLIDWRFQCE